MSIRESVVLFVAGADEDVELPLSGKWAEFDGASLMVQMDRDAYEIALESGVPLSYAPVEYGQHAVLVFKAAILQQDPSDVPERLLQLARSERC